MKMKVQNYQNLWDVCKIEPREKFIVLNAYIGKEKSFSL